MINWCVEFEKSYSKYIDALNTNNSDVIELCKYKLLFTTSNFFEVVISYIAAHDEGVYYDFGKSIIPKGSILYRIRRYEENTNFNDVKQWGPPPNKPQNRANQKGETALYLASTEDICLLETHINNGEKYVLGTYRVKEDIKVGGFYNRKHKLHDLAATILNAFLIAPSRNDSNIELFDFLDKQFKGFSVENMTYMERLQRGDNLILPLHFAVINKGNEYYKLTNKICSIISEEYSEGIRYSSCYIPFDTVGLYFNTYNIVLYNDGISKLEFLNFKIKTKIDSIDGLDILKSIVNQEVKHE